MRSKKRKRMHRYLSLLLVMLLVISTVSSGWAQEAAQDAVVTESENTATETAEVSAEIKNVQEVETSAKTETETPPETEKKTSAETETLAKTEEKSSAKTESKTRFTYADNQVKIMAVVREGASLPQNAVLRAKPLKAGTKAYKAALAKVEEACELHKNETMECIPYDIYFLVDGHRVEPEEGSVKVSIQFVTPVLGETPGRVADSGVAHIKEDGEVEQLDGKVQLGSSGEIKKVDFVTDSFSVFVPYTVTAQGSVARTVSGSTDLNSFITRAEITGANHGSDGKLILQNGETYGFKLWFAENSGHLFDKESELVYTVPQQLVPVAKEGTFNMVINSGGNTYTIEGNTYHMTGNSIKVKFNQEDAHFADLNNMVNAEFYLEFNGRVDADASGDTLKFGTSVEQKVTFNHDSRVTVNKTGYYNNNDKKDGRFRYYLDIVSVGENTNVVVTDEITGSLLTYNKDVKVDSVKPAGAQLVKNVKFDNRENGFICTIPSMKHGETVRLYYTASIDYSSLNGSTFKPGQTENTVTVNGDGFPESKKEHSFTHVAAYDDSVRKMPFADGINNGKQTIMWMIMVNQDAKVYVGGSQVKDSIKKNPRIPMKYTGTGITVYKYKDPTTMEGYETIPWDELTQFDEEDGWIYTIPENPNQTPYKYCISYYTEVDVSNAIAGGDLTVKNEAEFNGVTSGIKEMEYAVPVGNEFEVSKYYTSASDTEVKWEVDIKIPQCGFADSFTITDDLPDIEVNNIHYTDTYLDGSLKLAMNGTPVSGDLYTVTANNGKVTVHFDFSKQATKNLFAKSSAERTLKMTYITTPAPGWPKDKNHTNTVDVCGDSIHQSDTATFKLGDAGIDKEYDCAKKINDMPGFRFVVYLENVNSDSTTVTDVFDTSLFTVNTSRDNLTVGFGNTREDAYKAAKGKSEGGTAAFTPSEQGGTFRLTNLKQKKGGTYYGYYCLAYVLQVKDADALKQLQQQAADSSNHKVSVENVAYLENGQPGGSVFDKATATYEVQPLSKSITEKPTASNNYVAEYKLEINKNQLTLNGGEPITVTDTMPPHMRLLTNSMEVKTDGQPCTDYTYDFPVDKTGFTLTVPDGKFIEITYKVKIIGSGTVKYKNNVEITGGYNKSTGEQKVEINSNGGGTASEIAIHVIKRDKDDKMKTLAGAKFVLFKMQNGEYSAVKDLSGNNVEFVTDDNGMITLQGGKDKGWYLEPDDECYLKEIEAPAGYLKAPNYYFTVKKVATRLGEFVSGDTIDIYDIDPNTTITIGGVKTWEDNNNQYGKRPGSITLRLWKGDTEVGDPITVTAANHWKWSVSNLPKYDANGQEIDYRITEDPVRYYTGVVNGYNVTNTYTPEKLTVSGKKTWEDNEDQDGKRPESITVLLMKQIEGSSEETEEARTEVRPDSNGEWKWSFSNLPQHDEEGRTIIYSVKEVMVPDYGTVYPRGTYDIVNTHTPETTTVKGHKTWEDNNNQDGKRQTQIKVKLFENGVETSYEKTVTEADNWSWYFTELPKYKDG